MTHGLTFIGYKDFHAESVFIHSRGSTSLFSLNGYAPLNRVWVVKTVYKISEFIILDVFGPEAFKRV